MVGGSVVAAYRPLPQQYISSYCVNIQEMITSYIGDDILSLGVVSED